MLVITPAHAALLVELRHAGRRFVVIGAAAVAHHVELARTTSDVDLALVAEPADLRGLLEGFGWKRDPKQLQRWVDTDNNKLDIIAVTPELIRGGKMRFDGDAKELSLVGFDLALKHTVDVALPGSAETIEVATLAVVVILKMTAWLDRPHEREHDLGDIARLLDGFLPDDDDRRWEVPLLELLFELQSAAAVGAEVARIAQPQHVERIDAFLNTLRADDKPWMAVMAKLGGRVGQDPEDQMRQRLEAFRRFCSPLAG